MDYFNDERYWNINLLNKWFAISSILFLLSIIWMFVDDNDDDYKDYQREFRKLSIKVSEKKLEEELSLVEEERKEYELKYNQKLKEFNNKENILMSLEDKLVEDKAAFYKANMEYLGKKADIDEVVYLPTPPFFDRLWPCPAIPSRPVAGTVKGNNQQLFFMRFV